MFNFRHHQAQHYHILDMKHKKTGVRYFKLLLGSRLDQLNTKWHKAAVTLRRVTLHSHNNCKPVKVQTNLNAVHFNDTYFVWFAQLSYSKTCSELIKLPLLCIGFKLPSAGPNLMYYKYDQWIKQAAIHPMYSLNNNIPLSLRAI